MILRKEEKVAINLVEDNLTGEKLSKFIAFCFKYSDEIVVCQCHFVPTVINISKQFELIKWTSTTKTHCTTGPLSTVYHFKKNRFIEQQLMNMTSLYEVIPLDEWGNTMGEDLAFYKNGEIVCSICSHEKIGRLFLDENVYKEFHGLRIPHDKIGHQHQDLEAYLEECIYQERECLTLYNIESYTLPKRIGDMTSLRKLEIFEHHITKLPKALEKLIALQCLRITGNKVEHLDFQIEQLKHLKILDLTDMPLKVFPQGIMQLTELEELYLSGTMQDIPEELMNLKYLKVLRLPKLDASRYSAEFMEFVKRLEPKPIGIPLKEILGEEEWKKVIELGNWFVIGRERD